MMKKIIIASIIVVLLLAPYSIAKKDDKAGGKPEWAGVGKKAYQADEPTQTQEDDEEITPDEQENEPNHAKGKNKLKLTAGCPALAYELPALHNCPLNAL